MEKDIGRSLQAALGQYSASQDDELKPETQKRLSQLMEKDIGRSLQAALAQYSENSENLPHTELMEQLMQTDTGKSSQAGKFNR